MIGTFVDGAVEGIGVVSTLGDGAVVGIGDGTTFGDGAVVGIGAGTLGGDVVGALVSRDVSSITSRVLMACIFIYYCK